ncbi:16S rRNA (cytosine(967)-C(5))-methyltransferase RsmB [Gudongella oleilytica]|jgi:16S rRNA (cytosine967-C5)-methyltransferase|uniref:16S rRNA (cytosine(967)-C(5))-methyltransferase RsmB n=1 Tax=Gudongella oleilytica TaxID=1582259 RepID=UPI000FF88EFB|nr:16S rRNA (cytosine(967)-C(5))-methyltransferase RsmB [Gudongella oleilytica]
MESGRELAIKILNRIQNEGAYSTLAVKKALEDKSERKDSGFVRELVYGVLENQRLIDEIVKESSSVKIRRIHPIILIILRTAIYQLLFMDTVPESAIVNEAVNLAKKYGHRGTTGFVNALLRGVSSKKDYFKSEGYMSQESELGIRYSHPDYLVDLWRIQYGLEFTKDLLKANNSVPPFTIRNNSLKIDTTDLISILEAEGYETEPGKYSKDCVIIKNPRSMTRLSAYNDGLFTIQDEASMLVTEVLNPQKYSLILDVCSAPGGKATHIAQWIGDKGTIIARDIYPHKLKLIEELSLRLGIKSIKSEIWDATELDDKLKYKVDYCLVDAPCSGLGLIRRKPDIKWTRTSEELIELSRLQTSILKTASSYIKPGGILVYSTCTINRQENLDVVTNFLRENTDFRLLPIELANGVKISATQNSGYLELYPNIHGTDGFFMAKMVREG